MRKSILVLFLVVILILSGCATQPVETIAHKHLAKPQKPMPKLITVKHPWQHGQFQRGIQLYLHPAASQDGSSQEKQSISRNLNYVVSLGANAIGISFPIYTDGATPTHVYAGPDTPNLQLIQFTVSEAKKRQLRVMLRPIIDEKNIVAENALAWRGSIAPINTHNWFQSYQSLIVHYAELSKQLTVDELVIGTELSSLQTRQKEWQQLGSAVRHTGYKGVLSYAENWNNWASMPFSALAIDAYPHIQLNDQATVPQLSQALSHWFAQWPLSVRKNLTIQEAGILAQSGMYAHPWLNTGNGSIKESIQANWFAAMYDAAQTAHTEGIYYWMLDASHDPFRKSERQSAGSFVGREAGAVIKRNFER
ncbi:glycoside hydrolase family 113 [Sporolactobacillus pectinivorans]|uniref:glycoside hydrolase family 113 n=1 Tax=Sporolactobacillus pectinivorans TaxID=1591408 RepID=UPI000C25C856|nr:hypothetical protein [Sporolactobacillus pectinivorans]